MTRGQAMREARIRAGLTMHELADRTGLAYNTISSLERGEREGNIASIELLADAIGISIDEYIGHATKEKRHE